MQFLIYIFEFVYLIIQYDSVVLLFPSIFFEFLINATIIKNPEARSFPFPLKFKLKGFIFFLNIHLIFQWIILIAITFLTYQELAFMRKKRHLHTLRVKL